MALLTRHNSSTQCSIHVMLSVPGNRFLLIKYTDYGLWEVTFNTFVINFNRNPAVVARENLKQKLSLGYDDYELIPICSIDSALDDLSMKVFAAKVSKMFKFTSLQKNCFKVLSIDQIINDILLDSIGFSESSKYSSTSLAVLRNIGDSDLLWDKRLKNSWEKKSSLQV